MISWGWTSPLFTSIPVLFNRGDQSHPTSILPATILRMGPNRGGGGRSEKEGHPYSSPKQLLPGQGQLPVFEASSIARLVTRKKSPGVDSSSGTMVAANVAGENREGGRVADTLRRSPQNRVPRESVSVGVASSPRPRPPEPPQTRRLVGDPRSMDLARSVGNSPMSDRQPSDPVLDGRGIAGATNTVGYGVGSRTRARFR
jgi:hypothetical protein